jgi:Bacterial Ig-like domain (group 3)
VGETLPSGAAKSLIVNTPDAKLKLADITTDPPTFTELLTPGASSGVIGPDRCLYISNGEIIYKLAPTAENCGFAPITSLAPAFKLTPAVVTPNPAQGTSLTFTAQFTNLSVPVNTPVVFSSYGTNAQVLLGHTDAGGSATVSYRGTQIGSEALVAKATVGGTDYVSNTVEITWGAGKHASFLSLNDSPTAGTVGIPATLRATLTDFVVTPAVPIAGATIQFTLGSQSCNAVTNGSGVASCNVTPPAAGSYAMAATYAGNATYLPAAAAQSFVATGPPNTTLATSLSPVPVGTSFTLTATVTGTAPTGTVLFRNELAPLPNCTAVPLVGAGNTRTAQCSVNSLGVGSFALTADFSGDGSNFPSTATIIQVISANSVPPCGGFSDVDPSSVFCANVEWLRNRPVTLGCVAGLYCPNEVVFRLQMAAFMNRLGTAAADLVLSMQAQPGAIDLDTSTIVCQTTDFAIVNFPRRAIVDAILSGQGAADVSFVAEAVVSFDAGSTWAPLAETAAAGSAASGHWGNVRAAGTRDLDVGQNVRFGLRVSRGGLPGAGGLGASRCNLRTQIGNRVTGYSPLDP